MKTRSPNLGPTRWKVLRELHDLHIITSRRSVHRMDIAFHIDGVDFRTVCIALADLGRLGLAREVEKCWWLPVGELPPEPRKGKGATPCP